MHFMLLVFLGLLFLLGMGFSIPIIFLAWLKEFFWPKRRSDGLEELEFLLKWAIVQTGVGGIMLIGVPIAFFYVPLTTMVHAGLLYFLSSGISLVMIFYFLNTDVSRKRFSRNL